MEATAYGPESIGLTTFITLCLLRLKPAHLGFFGSKTLCLAAAQEELNVLLFSARDL
jgi:predicted transcriptional regulator